MNQCLNASTCPVVQWRNVSVSNSSPDSLKTVVPERSGSLPAAAVTASMLKPSHTSTTLHMSSSRGETSEGGPLDAYTKPGQVPAETHESIKCHQKVQNLLIT